MFSGNFNYVLPLGNFKKNLDLFNMLEMQKGL